MPSSTPDPKRIPQDQDYHSNQTTSVASAFPFALPDPFIPPMAASSSAFGGPCMNGDGNVQHWSRCHSINFDGQLVIERPELDVITNSGESIRQAMTRLRPYSQSSCRLVVNSSNLRTELSGVWIRGRVRDVVLTVSHFKKDPKIAADTMDTTAEVFTDVFGNLIEALPVKCKLFHDFNDPMGEQDFAIFAPCNGENSRSPAQAIEIATIFPEANSLSGIAISFGFNTHPTTPEKNHPNSNIHDCCCINCWYGSGNLVCHKLQKDEAVPDPRVLSAGWRTIAVGEWTQTQGQRQICHTATGWYGISGAGMYTQDAQGQVRLVALFQCGIFRGPDLDKNGAVVIPTEVIRRLVESGALE